jgi:hypothetical protein
VANRLDGARATRTTIATVPFDGTSVHLKVSLRRDGERHLLLQHRRLHLAGRGHTVSVGLDGQVDLSWRVQAWTGATIGLFAVKNGATSDNYADFDSFTVANLD